MSTPFWNHVARRPRHNAADDSEMRIQLIRTGVDPIDVMRAQLRDVSRDGLQLIVEQRLSEQEPVNVQIGQANSDFDLELAATVCWVEPEGKTWAIGCQFKEQLKWEEYGELFLNGILEAE